MNEQIFPNTDCRRRSKNPSALRHRAQVGRRAAAKIEVRLLAGAGVLLALLGLVALLLWSGGTQGLRSDPASVRKPGTLDALVTEVTNAPPQPGPNLFEGLTLEEEEEEEEEETTLTIKFPRPEPAHVGHIFDATVHPLRPGETVPIGAGEASLEYLAIGYGPPDAQSLSQDASVQVPGQCFRGDLEPVPADIVERQFDHWQRIRRYRGMFPEVRFVVRLEGIPEVKMLGGQVLDARTGNDLATGYMYGVERTSVYLQTELQAWHQTPVWVVLDIAHGPGETEDVVPELGLRIPHAWGVLQLIAIREGDQTEFSSFGAGGEAQIKVGFRVNSDKEETTFVFLGWPGVHPVPIDFEFLNASGQKLAGGGASTSGTVGIRSVHARFDKIRTMRIKRYPHVRRLVVQLPAVPGLPDANREVENLFDAVTPYVWFRNANDMRQFVERSLQMRWRGFQPGPPPPGCFPRAYTNATLREIFRDCLDLQPGGKQVRIISESHQIEVRPPFWKQLPERIRQLLHL